MLKKDDIIGSTKYIGLTIFFSLLHFLLYSQINFFKGVVKDEQTLKPVQGVNIKLYGTATGTSTDKTGNFSLRLPKTPATLVITCVGYSDAYYNIIEIPKVTVEFLLSPKSYLLQQVDISTKKYSFLFKDKDYSVLDYELIGGNILVLIFRYQLKRSELVLLSRSGDTLAISTLPEVPPSSLFKDFLLNVHYFSKANNSYQCFLNERNNSIEFLYKTSVDSILNKIKPFIFKISDRLYFQEKLANGFGTAFGFYTRKAGKKYIRKYLNEKKISEYIDDQEFYSRWNGFFGGNNLPDVDDIESDLAFDFSVSRIEGGRYGVNEARAHQIEYYSMIYPVVRTRDNGIAFFNFGSDRIELMDKDGNILENVPITFHHESKSSADSVNMATSSVASWRWGNNILIDEYSHNVYTYFHRNGMIKLQKIDLETGKLGKGTILPFPFPEKIEIYKSDAYFLIKSDGDFDNWKLVRFKL